MPPLDLAKFKKTTAPAAPAAGTNTKPLNLASFKKFTPPAEAEQTKEPGFFGSIYRGIAEPVVNLIARPGQVAAHLANPDEGKIEGEVPLGFGVKARVKDPYGDGARGVIADVGRGIQTVGLGLGPVAGSAAFGGGSALQDDAEQGKGIVDTVKDVAVNSAIGAVAGKATSLLFKGGGKVVKAAGDKLLAPFKSSYAPAVVEAAGRAGIKDLPVSAKTTSKFVQTLEASAKNSPAGAKIEKSVNDARGTLYKIATGLQKKIDSDKLVDTSITPESAGQAMQAAFQESKKVFDTAKDKIYGEVTPRIANNPAKLDATKKVLQDIITTKGASLDPTSKAQVRFYMQLLNATRTAQKRTFQAVKQTRTDIGTKLKNFNDPITSGDRANLKRLYGALSDDLDATASQFDPAAGEALTAANDFYKEGINRLNSTIGRTIFRSKSPERLVGQIIKPGQTTEIRALKDVVGEQAFHDVRTVFMNDLIEKSSNPVTAKIVPTKLTNLLAKYGDDTLTEVIGPEGLANLKSMQKSAIINDLIGKSVKEGRVMPATLAKQMDQYGDELLEKLLGKEDFQKLTDVRTLSRALNSGQKVAEGSQTAEKMSGILNMLAFATGNLKTLGGKLAAEFGLSKLVTSKLGQKYLTTGFGSLPKVSKVGDVISKIPEILKDAPKKAIPGTKTIERVVEKTGVPNRDIFRYSEKAAPKSTPAPTATPSPGRIMR